MIESTCLVTSLHLVQARMVKTCPKKVNKKKYFFVHYPSFNVKVLHFTFPLKICTFFKGMKHALLSYTLKKLKGFLNTTEYKIFLIKSFIIAYKLFVTYI